MTTKTELKILEEGSKFHGVTVILSNFSISEDTSSLTYEYEISEIPAGVDYTKYSLENIEEPDTLEFQQLIGDLIIRALEYEMTKRGIETDLN